MKVAPREGKRVPTKRECGKRSPNQGLRLTASSVRSAPASGSR
jgi:hypothetical protein